MSTYTLEIFADYNQIYLHDESAEADFADSWDDDAYKKMVVVTEGAIGLVTARNMDVPVEILLCESEPLLDLGEWEHAVSCGIELRSGVLIVRGPSDYLPDVQKINVEPGCYAAQILCKGLNTLSEDGLEGDDCYRVILWRSEAVEEFKLLKDSGFNS